MTHNKTLLTALLALTISAAIPAAFSLAAPSTTPPATAPKELGSLTGTVVDSTGKPVAGAIVRLHHHHHAKATSTTQPGSTTKPAHPAFRETTTDANGNFTFANVHAGHHLVVARDKGVGHAEAKVEITAGQAATTHLTLEKSKPAAK